MFDHFDKLNWRRLFLNRRVKSSDPFSFKDRTDRRVLVVLLSRRSRSPDLNTQKLWNSLVSRQTVITVIIFYYYNYCKILKNHEYPQIIATPWCWNPNLKFPVVAVNRLRSSSRPNLPLWTQVIIIIIQVGVLFSLPTAALPRVDPLSLCINKQSSSLHSAW